MPNPRVYDRRRIVAAILAATLVFSSSGRAAELPTGPFAIKPPDMNVPAGTKPGALRRMIQPFGPWTLICDENLKARTRLCNVSQTLVDTAGRTVFSWSLAASQSGAPIFVLRLPAALAEDHFVQVVFAGQYPHEVGVILSLCNAEICLGYLQLDSKIKREIASQARVLIKARIGPRIQTFEAKLDGLEQAVASLK